MIEPLHAHVEPLIFAFGSPAAVAVVASDEGARLPPGSAEVLVRPRRGKGAETRLTGQVGTDGVLRFTYRPSLAGEHAVEVRAGRGNLFEAGSFYVLEPSLAGLVPLRGDLHVHTWHSDGRSSPAGMLRRAVEIGLDFIAITDHNNYAGTLEALAEAPRYDGVLTVLRGEEVSFDRGHLVAVGLRDEVAAQRQRPAFAEELAAVTTELSARGLGAESPLADLADGVWAARKIRELGGLAFVAHPYWLYNGEYHIDWRVAGSLLLDGEVDGVELLGDVLFEENLLSIALYTDLVAQGLVTTVLGNSDTHGARHTFGSYWSVVLAADDSPEAVMQALRDRLSVACVRLPGEQLRIYGPLALVQYAYFLHRTYFPRIEAAVGTAADLEAAGTAKAALQRRLLGR